MEKPTTIAVEMTTSLTQSAFQENETTTTLQSNYAHPTMMEYYTHLTPLIITSMFIAILILILNTSIYLTTVSDLRKRVKKPLLRPSVFLVSLYPVISAAAVLTLLVPKAWLVCHTVMHLSFTIGAIVFRRLCFQYVESEVNFIKETDGASVSIATPPCCCCCLCLPLVRPGRAKLCMLRYLVWQMPFVQGGIMLVLNVIYYREPEFYRDVFLYFIPFIIASIILGVWGLNITVRMINSVHSEFGLLKKMFSLQLVLLLCKLQYLILDSQLNSVQMGSGYPINHTITKQTFINMLILFEMVLVSLLAQSAYKLPVQIVERI